jgi:RNA polymerase sigma factor (sigma-70 family)
VTDPDAGGGVPARRPAAFDASVLACRPALLRLATKLARDPVRAEDLVQDAIVRALANHVSFQEGSNIAAWTSTILYNAFVGGARKRRREVEDPDGVHAGALSVPAAQVAHLELGDVRKRLRVMPKPMRDVLARAMMGEAYEDIALAVGCEVGTVKSRLNRARAFLDGGEFEPEDPLPPPAREDLGAALRIKALFAEGGTASGIAAELGLPASEVMAVILALRLTRKPGRQRGPLAAGPAAVHA